MLFVYDDRSSLLEKQMGITRFLHFLRADLTYYFLLIIVSTFALLRHSMENAHAVIMKDVNTYV